MQIIVHETKDIATAVMDKSEYEQVANAIGRLTRVKEYAQELRIHGSPESVGQIATDILYLIGEK